MAGEPVVSRTIFKTARDAARYLAAYEASLRHWAVPYEELDLPSRFGRTHVIASGPSDAPPLVLLHGYGISSTMWAHNVRDLARRYRVYAVDILGQAGKSQPQMLLSTRAACVEWVASVLDGLGIGIARLAGVSYGGWLALNYAIAAPERLRVIALISPGGLTPLSRQLGVRGMLVSLVPSQLCSDLVLMRWISSSRRFSSDEQRALARLLSRQLYLGLRVRGEFARGGAPALPFSDDELCSLRVPMLLLVGEEEVLYAPAEALSRARRLIPDLVGEMIPHANHDLAFRQPDLVDARLLAFFAAVDARLRPTRSGGEAGAHLL